MRKKYVIGNWKMNHDAEASYQLFSDLQNLIHENDVCVAIAPPAVFLAKLSSENKGKFDIAAQNVYHEKNGAYTGEVSASILHSVGVKYALVGHSERRSLFGESEEILSKKVDSLIAHGLVPVYCCGETLEERTADTHFDVLKHQIAKGLFHLTEENFSKVVVAYEPVWAIGTGVTASSAQAEEMHAYIRGLIEEKYGRAVAQNTSILYGGSCKPDNAVELFACANVDGGLIGGASLQASSFLEIIKAF